jgi:predicted nucleic acid-binding protein
MPETYTKPYLDANVYIAVIKGPTREDPEKVRTAAAILQLAEEGHFQVYGSTFVAAEVIKVPGDPAPLSAEQERVIVGYFQRDFMVLLELDLLTAEKARELARDHGLKPPDAVHVATAIRAGCDQFLTWDEKVHKGGRTIEGVYICEPHVTGRPMPLFSTVDAEA